MNKHYNTVYIYVLYVSGTNDVSVLCICDTSTHS